MRARYREHPWTDTPLGPVEQWPATLRTMASLVLAADIPMTLLWGPSLLLLYNDAYAAVVGTKHPAALGMPLQRVWPETADVSAPLIARAQAGETVTVVDTARRISRRAVGADLETAYFTLSYTPVRDDAGTVVGILLTVLETTPAIEARELQAERERLLAQIAAERERLRAVILHAPAPMALHVGPEHRYELVNDAYRRLGGRPYDILGMPVREAFPEIEGQGIFEALDRVYATGEPFIVPELLIPYNRTGAGIEDAWINVRLEPLRDADGKVSAILNFSFDLTAQVRARLEVEAANAQLAHAASQFHTLADAIPALAWTARADGHVEWYNARWYEYTGTTPADMEGWGWQSVHDPAVLPAVMEAWQAAIQAGSGFEMTFPLRGADGRFRQFLTRITPVRDATGHVTRWFGTNTDIEAERAARIAAEQAASRTAQLQSLTAELASAATLDEVGRIVVAAGERAFGASTSTLIMADWKTGEAVIEHGIGLSRAMTRQYARFPLTLDIPATEAMRRAIPIFVGSQAELLRRYPGASDFWTSQHTQAIASVPLTAGGMVIGAMSFTFAHAREFSAEEMEFLVLLGRQAALAADRARLFAAERTAKERAEQAQATLTETNQQLQEQQLEMELTNQALQDNTVELEAQTEELQATAAQLEERTEEAEAARRTLGSIVEAVTDGFVAFDAGLRFTYVNAQAAAMWRRPAETLLGKTPFEAWPETRHSVPVAALERVLASGKPEIVEGLAPSLGKPIELRAYPSSGGGIVAFFTDLTDRRRAAEAASFLAEASRVLASSSDYQTTLGNLARAAVPRLGDWCAVDVLTEPDRDVWPPKIERVAVVHEDPAKMFLATSLTTRFPQDWSRETGSPGVIRSRQPMFVPEVTDAMLKAGAQNPEHYALLRKLDFRSVIIAPLIARDRVLGTMTLVMAESGRLFGESDLALAVDLGHRAGVALDNARLLRDAAEANAAKTEFLRTISHELRQPLNAMKGYIGLWTAGLRGALSPQMQDDVARLARNQEHLATLIEDLLSFTRLEAGQLRIEQAAVAMDEVFTVLEAMIRPEMDARRIGFSYLPCDVSVAALGDRDRIVQICLNLVTNAMRATEAAGQVTIQCVPGRGHLTIEVTDTGSGIPEDKLESIFSPFVQVGRSLSAPKEGAGLGLAICRGLATAMGGTLTVRSVLGEGSTFSLTLPRA